MSVFTSKGELTCIRGPCQPRIPPGLDRCSGGLQWVVTRLSVMGLCVHKLTIGSCLSSAPWALNCNMVGDELRSLFAFTGVEEILEEHVITAGVNSVLVFSWIGIMEQEIRDRAVNHWVHTLPSPVQFATWPTRNA